MRQVPVHFFSYTMVAVAALLLIVAALGGGPDFSGDLSTIYRLASERSANPALTRQAVLITYVGSAEGLLTILLLAGIALAAAKRWRDLVSLTAIVVGGRLLVELLKLAIGRPRPVFGPYPVEVSSLSFPSGHAANSMMTFLALALIAAPKRWRVSATIAAIVFSLVIGATRPLLGVHWPSDVIGGWALGIGWVVGLVALTRRWRGAAE
jgi:undecaprenyl-diphosphatase